MPTEVAHDLRAALGGAAGSAALAAVVVYRVFNFVLPTLPALAARPGIEPLLFEARARRRRRLRLAA